MSTIQKYIVFKYNGVEYRYPWDAHAGEDRLTSRERLLWGPSAGDVREIDGRLYYVHEVCIYTNQVSWRAAK